MKKIWIALFAVALLCSIAISQERIDVVYLKNGDIRKGVIIENVPNDHIKIEMADGSTFTIPYSDIQKMTKEGKEISQQSGGNAEASKGLMSRHYDVGMTLAVWGSGTVDYKLVYSADDPQKSTGVLFHFFVDGYIAEQLAIGAYINVSPVSWDNYSATSTMTEIGVALKGRFPIADGAAVIKPGVGLGRRGFSSDDPMGDKISALAVNLSCEVQFDIHSTVVPFVEIGGLGQPSGSNDYDPAITFPPIPYFGIGIVF